MYHGIVKQGKIELEEGPIPPEGTRVRIEPVADDWYHQLEEIAREVTRKWTSPRSAVELLSEMRR